MAMERPRFASRQATGTAFALAQALLLAFAHMPGVSQPARGAFLLMSFWCLGGLLGSMLAAGRRG